MICILKIYQRANNTRGCLQISAERCVSNLQRDALFRRVKGAAEDFFYFLSAAHLKGKRVTHTF